MNDFYLAEYSGPFGSGFTVLYIGHQIIMGGGAGGSIFRGNYVERDGRIEITIKMLNGNLAAKSGGTDLIVGGHLPDGATISIIGSLPAEFDTEEFHKVTIRATYNGANTDREIPVRFENIGRLPNNSEN